MSEKVGNNRNAPVIGLVLDFEYNPPSVGSFSSMPFYAVREHYIKATQERGALVIALPYNLDTKIINQTLDLLSGLIIPGSSNDINPKFYNQENSKSLASDNNTKTIFESNLLQSALDRDMPFLGICHGMQLFNVLMGGSLIQDISDYTGGIVNHKSNNQTGLAHEVVIKPDSLLYNIAYNTTNTNTKNNIFLVNSHHHQGVLQLGKNLTASAISPKDGVIEAIESDIHSFALGVIWHPEYGCKNNLDSSIFDSFIDAAKSFIV